MAQRKTRSQADIGPAAAAYTKACEAWSRGTISTQEWYAARKAWQVEENAKHEAQRRTSHAPA